MKRFITLALITVIAARCRHSKQTVVKKTFTTFDFSYNNTFESCFSIKFTYSDTVFIRQHFATISIETPKSNTSYYAVLPHADRTRLDSFLTAINFSQFDSAYYEDYADGMDYQFYYANDTIHKLLLVHSDSVPIN
jgi:hypothetical protein